MMTSAKKHGSDTPTRVRPNVDTTSALIAVGGTHPAISGSCWRKYKPETKTTRAITSMHAVTGRTTHVSLYDFQNDFIFLRQGDC